ncbi:MAG TPA: hypothetical protein PLF08_00420, partial [Bacillota bacterium]|nr:hypothetical protein [Bacillota bacterium]HOK63739.1 hypothetical protein [Bacillota bacterium]HPZ77549.1 hypothetical protein [Bacillota bacterium]HQD73642.1 hypothetical protein [Bacillota bacterium]
KQKGRGFLLHHTQYIKEGKHAPSHPSKPLLPAGLTHVREAYVQPTRPVLQVTSSKVATEGF